MQRVVAQSHAADSVPVVVRVVVRHLDRLAADPAIKRLRPGANGMSLLSSAPLSELGQLRDSALVADYDVMRKTLEQANVHTCAATWVQGSGVTSSSFVQLIASADSSLAEEWGVLIAPIAEAGVRGRLSGGELASKREMQEAIATARQRLPAVDQAHLMQLASGRPMTETDGVQRYERFTAVTHCYLRRALQPFCALLPRRDL